MEVTLTLSHLNQGPFCLAQDSVGSKRRKEMLRFGFQFCRCFEERGELRACTRASFGLLNSALWMSSEDGLRNAVWKEWPTSFTPRNTTPWMLFLSLAQANIASSCCCPYLWETELTSLPTGSHRIWCWPSYQNWVKHKSLDKESWPFFLPDSHLRLSSPLSVLHIDVLT